MSVGLLALLDDVATLAKVAAASLDDVAGQAAKAGTKAAGVVIDDAAVTPKYVIGFAAERELPIVAKIARGSLINKIIILLPAALLLSLFAPWAITPLLMAGGLYLCYEGAEKVYEALFPHAAQAHESRVLQAESPEEMEELQVRGAIRTDFILSAEIMAIVLATVATAGIWTQAAVLSMVGLMITLGVYGVVALIVKADDIGLALARNESPGPGGRMSRLTGRLLVVSMPVFMQLLSVVGTAAMIWVGGGILIHGLASFGLSGVEHTVHQLSLKAGQAVGTMPATVGWIVSALAAGVFGLAAGLALIPVIGKGLVPLLRRLRGQRSSADGAD